MEEILEYYRKNTLERSKIIEDKNNELSEILKKDVLEQILLNSKGEKIYVLGHINPDTDSIFSSYLLSNILKSMNIDSEFCVLEKDYEYCDSDKKLILNYLPINPQIINSTNNKKFILVDHNKINKLPKENIIGAIDHHVITGEIDNLIEIEYASTALLIYNLFKDKYKFNKKEKELIFLSVLADTDYLCSSRFKEEDNILLEELNVNLDVKKLQKKYFTITNFNNHIEVNLKSNYKEYNYNNKNIKRTLIYSYKDEYDKYYNSYLDYINDYEDYLLIWCDFESKKTYIYINKFKLELDYIVTSTYLILDMLKGKIGDIYEKSKFKRLFK